MLKEFSLENTVIFFLCIFLENEVVINIIKMEKNHSLLKKIFRLQYCQCSKTGENYFQAWYLNLQGSKRTFGALYQHISQHSNIQGSIRTFRAVHNHLALNTNIQGSILTFRAVYQHLRQCTNIQGSMPTVRAVCQHLWPYSNIQSLLTPLPYSLASFWLPKLF